MINWLSNGFASALPQPAGSPLLSRANSDAKVMISLPSITFLSNIKGFTLTFWYHLAFHIKALQVLQILKLIAI